MFSSKMKMTLPILALILAVTVGAFFVTPRAQATTPEPTTLAPCYTPPPPLRTITVVGRGSVFMQPDVAHTLIGVQVADPDIKIASKKAQETIAAVKKALVDQGVAEKDIQTADYSIHMQMDDEVRAMMRAQGETPTSPHSYYVRTALSVTIRDVEKVGDVMAAAIEAGANDIYGISFSAENPEEVMAQARKMAAEDARARAEELAALHGVTVGDVISISEVISGNMPLVVEKTVAMGGGGGFASGQLQMSAQLQVVYAIQSESDTPTVLSAPPESEKMVDATPPSEVTPINEVNKVTISVVPDMQNEAKPLIIEGDDPDLLRRFVSYWFASEALPFMPQEANPRLVLGQLPEDLPLPADVFKGFDVLGVLDQGAELGESILLATQEDAQTALDALAQQLKAAGLQEPANALGMMGGFGLDAASIPTLYCNEKDGSWLTVTANSLGEEGAVVRVDIEHPDGLMGGSPCDTPKAEEFPLGAQLLPPLEAPADARVITDSAGGGPDNFYQSAIIYTSLTMRDLASHYQEQLEKAGWELVGSDNTKAIAWSEWELQDEKGNPWIGSLLIVKRFAKEDSYVITVRVERSARGK